jgi:hypothetical protein
VEKNHTSVRNEVRVLHSMVTLHCISRHILEIGRSNVILALSVKHISWSRVGFTLEKSLLYVIFAIEASLNKGT